MPTKAKAPKSAPPIHDKYYWIKPHGGKKWLLSHYFYGLWYVCGDAVPYAAVKHYVPGPEMPEECK